mmetsp:Transcript_2998/g.9276  ORF Transcript_2998/g.9276 Transcript_2998/m.9276 type:complete len:230 (+) Transcript_2998:190-879(+)
MTIRVLVAFSMVYLVLPLFPANLPMPLLMCSPLNVCFTSFTSKHSKYKSSKRNSATASWISNPRTNACIKSADFCSADSSSVLSVVFNSTFLNFKFIRISIFICFVTGVYKAIQCSFSGENLCAGTFTFRYIAFWPFSTTSCFPRGAKIGRNGSFGFASANNAFNFGSSATSDSSTSFPVLLSTTASFSSSSFFLAFGMTQSKMSQPPLFRHPFFSLSLSLSVVAREVL